MSREAYEAKKRFERACRAEGAETHRLGTMSPRTRGLWRAATLTRARDEAAARRRAGGW